MEQSLPVEDILGDSDVSDVDQSDPRLEAQIQYLTMSQEQKELKFQEQEDQFLLKMQLKESQSHLKESTDSKHTLEHTLDDSFRIRQLKAEVRALQEQNQILQDELKNVME